MLQIIREELPSGFEITSLFKPSKQELIQKAKEADYFLAGGRIPIDREVLDSAANLKMIQRTGVGLDSFDLNALKKRNIPLYVNRGVNSRSVAEHSIMLILAVLRRLPVVDSSVKKGSWLKHELGVTCCELYKKTVGLIGLGSIGTEVAAMLNAFGANIFYFDPFRISKDKEAELAVSYRPLQSLISEVDILSLHCPFTSETETLIGSDEISSMRPGSILINTSRGQLIDEAALVSALKSGHLKGAGLDVFSKEPLSKNNALLDLENVVLTPHLGGVTRDAFQRMMTEAFRNIELFEKGNIEEIECKRVRL